MNTDETTGRALGFAFLLHIILTSNSGEFLESASLAQ
jgi:hypothetical protein